MMAKSPKAPDAKDAKDEKPAKKSKRKLLIIVAAVLLLVAGGAGYVMLGAGSSSTPAVATSPKPGKVTTLDAVTVNLASGHYLKVQIGLLGVEGAADAGAPNTPRVTDLIISEFSNREMAELSSDQGRIKIKTDLLAKLQSAYPDQVMGIYFLEFVMQ